MAARSNGRADVGVIDVRIRRLRCRGGRSCEAWAPPSRCRLLDAMVPAFTPLARAQARPRTRFGADLHPQRRDHGAVDPGRRRAGLRRSSRSSSRSSRSRISSSSSRNLTRSHPGSQVGDHAVSAAGFLTGVWPKRTEAEDVLANTTIDQVVAQQIGQDTPFPSLEVATEDFTGYVGACSPGFNCAYLNTISWSTPSTPLPMDINPRVVFERMFGQGGSPAQRAAAHRATSAACSTRSPRRRASCSAGSARATVSACQRLSRQPARDRAAHPARRGAAAGPT